MSFMNKEPIQQAEMSSVTHVLRGCPVHITLHLSVHSKDMRLHSDPLQYLDVLGCLEAIQLIEQLQHRPLHLTVPAWASLQPRWADGVYLIHEDDGRSMLSCHDKEFSHHTGTCGKPGRDQPKPVIKNMGINSIPVYRKEKARTLSDKFLDQLWSRHPDEGAVSVMGHSSGKEGLPCTWGAIEQHTLQAQRKIWTTYTDATSVALVNQFNQIIFSPPLFAFHVLGLKWMMGRQQDEKMCQRYKYKTLRETSEIRTIGSLVKYPPWAGQCLKPRTAQGVWRAAQSLLWSPWSAYPGRRSFHRWSPAPSPPSWGTPEGPPC